ncbi:MAG TPA: nucleotidyltransferase family protein [Thermoanaerobaculia bacterium]|nr:nucleotidyltransferase family protein [Thermoanaerobaculia bacterium]
MIGLVLLAAGGSRRFGSPKQLAVVEGETLLRRACRTAAQFPGRAVVVLGAHAETLRAEVEGVEIVINDDWERGIATSIHAGVRALADTDAIVIALADQPAVGLAELLSLVAKHEETGAPIVAAAYGNTIGVPALFHRSLFDELLALSGDEGARKLLRTRQVVTVAMSNAAWDIDQVEDL